MADHIPTPDDELAALLALDALPADEQADAELRVGTFPAGLVDVVAALAEASAEEPPAQLRAQVLARALARRPAGLRTGGVVACSPAEAYDRTVAEFGALLTSLSGAEWAARAHGEHGTVRDLVAHLVGVERLTVGWLDASAPPPVDPHVDHVTATRPVVDELAGADGPAVAAQWRDAARSVAAQAAAQDPAAPASFHDVATTVDGLLVIRTFELWAHWMDIALAVGRSMPILDAPRMALLSATFMDVVPAAMAQRGEPAPRGTARFVLTGAAGSCYTVALEAGQAVATEPDVTIVADVIDICRVAARRLDPEALDATIEGDAELGRAVLARLDTLARD